MTDEHFSEIVTRLNKVIVLLGQILDFNKSSDARYSKLSEKAAEHLRRMDDERNRMTDEEPWKSDD